MLGFNLDTSNIETELANCRAVYEKYYSELFTGAQDPRELVKTIDAELETAGWEDHPRRSSETELTHRNKSDTLIL